MAQILILIESEIGRTNMGRGKSSWYKERKTATIPVRTNNLIICVGKETEKNYFVGAINYFYQNEKARENVSFDVVVDSVDPLNMAYNAQSIVSKIEKENRIKLNHVWVVFDKDDFPNDNFDNTIMKLNSMSSDNIKYHALWSNKCFELWLLLNFVRNQAAISVSEYMTKLSEYLGEKYKKNDKDIFNKIIAKRGRISTAIRYAKSLIGNSAPSANDPATTVYEFFEFYIKYLNI